MKTHDALRGMLESARMVTGMYLGDFSDDELLVRPVPGANHLAWQLGHLLKSEAAMLNWIVPDASPKLPDGFVQHHDKQNAGSDKKEDFLSKAEYLSLHHAQREATMSVLGKLSESDLDTPGPEASRSYAPTFGAIITLIASHELMHAGQIAVIRRKLGKAYMM